MLRIGKIDRTPFEFNGNNIASNLFQGLKNYGPYDYQTREFKKIEIDVLFPLNKRDLINEFMKNLKSIFQSLFLIEDLWYNLHPFRTIDDIIYDNELSRKPENPTTNKIILHYHHELNPKYNAPYYKVKRQFLGMGIPTQGLLANNLRTRGPYLNNVACGIYAKSQGRPWTIKGTISEKLEGLTIYMGFDVSRKQYGRAKHASPGCIVVYDENGQYIYHFTEIIPISHEYMDTNIAQNLIETTIGRVKARKGREPDNIVFMRDGDIHDSEILGFKKALAEKQINLFILEIRKAGNIPILKKANNGNYTLADSGTYMSIENNDKYRNLDIFVQTLGPEMNLPSVPKAVKVSPRFVAGENIDINNTELIEDIARQVLILSHLNWSGLRGRTKLPITIHFAHEAALLMESGIAPQNIDSMALWML